MLSNLMIKSNSLYLFIKGTAQIILPALATLYFTLAEVWDYPYGAEVVATITAVDTFLGVLLSISSKNYIRKSNYYDGYVEVHETAEKKTYSLSLDSDPHKLDEKGELRFKVRPTEHDI